MGGSNLGFTFQIIADVNERHGNRIRQPVLLAVLIHLCDTVECDFHGTQHWGKERALAIDDQRHVAAERFHQRNNDGAKRQDLHAADEGHGAPL
jgi:hypothetical protein